jgi:hypothetical protein
MASRRKEIVEYVVTQLINIDGGVSTYDGVYSYNTNLFTNVYRKLKFLDEVNDFPAIYVSAGTEIRNFNSKDLTVATLDVTIRAYVYGEDNSQSLADDLVQDIEHVIYSLEDKSDIGIQDITIDNISTDEGLATPYGLAEIELTTVYRLNN